MRLARWIPEPYRQYAAFQDLRKPIKLLAPFVLKHWKPHAGLLLLALVEIGLMLTFAWFVGAITDAAVGQRFDRLMELIPIALLLTGVSITAGYIGIQLELHAATRLKKDFQERLYHHMMRLPVSYTNKTSTGELMTHFSQDLHGIDGMVGPNLVQLIRLPLIFIAVFLYMIHIHWQLSLISLAAAPFAALAGAWFGVRLRRNSRSLHDQVGRMNGYLHESLQGLMVIRSFTLESRFFQTFFGHSERLYMFEQKDAKLRGGYSALGQAGGSGIFLLSMCLGAYFVSVNEITVGSLLAYVNLTSHLVYPLTGLAALWVGLQKALPAIERLSGVLEQKPETRKLPGYVTNDAAGLSIRFEAVSFQYEEGRHLFDRFQLDIPAGQTVALVGASGAGKSTLFHLLQGYYKPTSGRIYLGEQPIDEMFVESLRSQIALVPQETFLFAGTIRDNLMLARPDVTEEEMIQAAVQANIHSLIMSLPEGYDTLAGERGVSLSGGQRQRISIARALLKRAPILLLDEATSSLDSESEFHVMEGLNRLHAATSCTTIIIAHRLSTVYQADRIVVLDQGRIAESGTHDQLMNIQDGVYRNLVMRQIVEEQQSEPV